MSNNKFLGGVVGNWLVLGRKRAKEVGFQSHLPFFFPRCPVIKSI